MSDIAEALDHYARGVEFTGVSPFEVLDLLDTRSRLAEHEAELSADQRARLEAADGVFLQNAPAFLESLQELGSPAELRHRAGAACSHWWWYLDKLSQRERIAT